MYRLLVPLVLLSIANSSPRYSSSGCRYRNYHSENLLNSVSRDLISFDNKFKEVCRQFLNILPMEVISPQTYRLEYYLPQFSGNFDVRVIHRALYINGHDPKVQGCDQTYVDMRVLPFFVDAHQGSWDFEYGKFSVEFPYKYSLTEFQTNCGQDIDETLIHVRKGSGAYSNYG